MSGAQVALALGSASAHECLCGCSEAGMSGPQRRPLLTILLGATWDGGGQEHSRKHSDSAQG